MNGSAISIRSFTLLAITCIAHGLSAVKGTAAPEEPSASVHPTSLETNGWFVADVIEYTSIANPYSIQPDINGGTRQLSVLNFRRDHRNFVGTYQGRPWETGVAMVKSYTARWVHRAVCPLNPAHLPLEPSFRYCPLDGSRLVGADQRVEPSGDEPTQPDTSRFPAWVIGADGNKWRVLNLRRLRLGGFVPGMGYERFRFYETSLPVKRKTGSEGISFNEINLVKFVPRRIMKRVGEPSFAEGHLPLGSTYIPHDVYDTEVTLRESGQIITDRLEDEELVGDCDGRPWSRNISEIRRIVFDHRVPGHCTANPNHEIPDPAFRFCPYDGSALADCPGPNPTTEVALVGKDEPPRLPAEVGPANDVNRARSSLPEFDLSEEMLISEREKLTLLSNLESNRLERIQCQRMVGSLLAAMNRPDEAIPYLQQALDSYSVLDKPEAQWICLQFLAEAQAETGLYAESKATWEKALNLVSTMKSPGVQRLYRFPSMLGLASAWLALGELTNAIAVAERATEPVSPPFNIREQRTIIAESYRLAGDYNKSIAAFASNGNATNLSSFGLGLAYCQRGLPGDETVGLNLLSQTCEREFKERNSAASIQNRIALFERFSALYGVLGRVLAERRPGLLATQESATLLWLFCPKRVRESN